MQLLAVPDVVSVVTVTVNVGGVAAHTRCAVPPRRARLVAVRNATDCRRATIP